MAMIARAGKAILDILFPIECLGCAAEGEWLCSACRGKFPFEINDVCFSCKQAAPGGRTCFSCQRAFPLSYVARFFNYDEPLVKESIQTAKYNYIKDVFEALGDIAAPQLMSKFELLDIDPRALFFVPLPLHRRRLRERGFNQAEVLAKRFARELGATCVNALARRRATLSQADLDEQDRAANIKGAFRCVNPAAVKGTYAVLVDDVATTGATLADAARALKEAGAREVGGLVLAKG